MERSLLQRIKSATLLIIGLLIFFSLGLVFNVSLAFLFRVLILFASGLLLLELYDLSGLKSLRARALFTGVAAIGPVSSLAWSNLEAKFFISLGVSLWLVWAFAHVAARDNLERLKKLFQILIPGLCYIIIGISSFLTLSYQSSGMILVFWVILICVLTDTGAYFFGRGFGKIRLASELSPNKSLEGALGGLFVSALIGGIFLYCFNFTSLYEAIGWSGLLSIGAQLGDLFESYLKRTARIKDTGWFLPGHGGIFDRIDSHLGAAPLALVFLSFI